MKKFLLGLTAFLLAVNAWAQIELPLNENDVLYFYVINGTTNVTLYQPDEHRNFSNTEIIIPKDFYYGPDEKTYTVTAISNGAFSGSNITKITIPNTVTKIDDYAFNYCYDLKSVTMSDQLQELGSYAFESCTSLESLNIPNTLQIIGSDVFSGCDMSKICTVYNDAYYLGDGFLRAPSGSWM